MRSVRERESDEAYDKGWVWSFLPYLLLFSINQFQCVYSFCTGETHTQRLSAQLESVRLTGCKKAANSVCVCVFCVSTPLNISENEFDAGTYYSAYCRWLLPICTCISIYRWFVVHSLYINKTQMLNGLSDNL